jgi:transposase
MVSGKNGDPRSALTQGTHDSREGKAIEHAAKMVGVGATTVHKIARIKREHPERIKEIEDGHKTANAVHIELFESN